MKNTVYKISKDDGITTSVKKFMTLYGAFSYLAGIAEKGVREKVSHEIGEYSSKTGGKTRLLDIVVNDRIGNKYRLWADNEKTRREYVK